MNEKTTCIITKSQYTHAIVQKKKSGYDGDCQRLIKLVIVGDPGKNLRSLRLRDRRAVGVARQFLQPRLSRTESKLAKSNLLDTKQGG